MVKLMFIMFPCWWKIKLMYLKQLCSFTNCIAQVTLCRSGRSRSLRSEISWRTARSAHEVVSTSYWHPGSPHGRERIGSGREASTTVLNYKTLSCWSWLQPPSGTRSDHNFKFRKMHLKMSSARCSHFDPASHVKYPLPNPDKAQQTQNVYIVFRV